MSINDLLDVPLTEDERSVLRCGLLEWRGPARCTPQMALAMGFQSRHELFAEGDRLREALNARHPLTQRDWVRVLLATEIVFISDVMGSGHDWSITTGFTNTETLDLLRSMQRKIPTGTYSLDVLLRHG